MALQIKQGHNQIAYLVKEPKWSQFHDMIDLLTKSYYYHVLTVNPPIHVQTLQTFWANARTTVVDKQVVALVSTIKDKTFAITPEILSSRLHLDDNDFPLSIPEGEIHATMVACDYTGDLSHATIYKRYFDPQYKFLFHHIIMCLSPKTAGWDQMPSDLQQIFHSIVTGAKFRASNYFFNEMVINHQKAKNKFLLYPRFLMQCIIEELGDEAILGPKTVSSGLGPQIFARHNTPALLVVGDQRAEPNPKEPTPTIPQKAPKKKSSKVTKPKQPEKATQEDEMPADASATQKQK